MVSMSTLEGVFNPEMGKGANKYSLFLRVYRLRLLYASYLNGGSGLRLSPLDCVIVGGIAY